MSANSPTPDDDYFAEETVMAYCTEDTPYNKSTATSLSDLSVIDDDGQLFETKSGLCMAVSVLCRIVYCVSADSICNMTVNIWPSNKAVVEQGLIISLSLCGGTKNSLCHIIVIASPITIKYSCSRFKLVRRIVMMMGKSRT